jgi:hypothetical protein
MAVSANIFEKCLPAIGNNINECGAVTTCSVIAAEADELAGIFTSGSDFRDLHALLATQFEIKACGAKQNGLYDFLMSNKRIMNKPIKPNSLGPGNSEIDPFVMAYQRSVINSEYWTVVQLLNTSGNNYQILVRSRSNVPLDVRWFVPGMRVFVFARSAAGTGLRGSFIVTGATTGTSGGNDVIIITATGENSTLGWVAKAAFTGTLTAAFLVRGTNNVQDVERWCYNRPALNDRKHVPFWWQVSRNTMCTDQLYEHWFNRLRDGNEYFKLFGNVDAAERNRQLGMMNQREWVNSFFWNKRISSNQTLNTYRSLEDVVTFSNSTQGLYIPGEGRCVGRRANAIGVYEQLSECGRVFDLQNNQLNLIELFEQVIYDIYRARGDQGIPNGVIEIFTDSFTAQQFQRGMIRYYDERSDGLARFVIDTKQVMLGQFGQLGFNYDEYKLQYPVVTIRVVTHPFFDDFASAANDEGIQSTGRMLWILDFTGIYPGILQSNRKVHRTGDIEALAKVDQDYACVMENPTQEISLNSLMWTAVVECPANNAIIENFSDDIPAAVAAHYPYGDIYGP